MKALARTSTSLAAVTKSHVTPVEERRKNRFPATRGYHAASPAETGR
jgi:hypothetical protein